MSGGVGGGSREVSPYPDLKTHFTALFQGIAQKERTHDDDGYLC
jgi:hypothetical protein